MSTKAHEMLYKRLMGIRDENPGFYFGTRKKGAKLMKGKWFLGNEDYISIPFWEGTDTHNKTPNVSFVVIPPKSKILGKRDDCTSFIQLTARDSSKKTKFLERMSEVIPGFELYGKGEWNKRYRAHSYLKNLDDFLVNDKPMIDEMIRNGGVEGLSLLTEDSLKHINNIELIRSNQI